MCRPLKSGRDQQTKMARTCNIGQRNIMKSNRGRGVNWGATGDHVRRLCRVEKSVPLIGPRLDPWGIFLERATGWGRLGGVRGRSRWWCYTISCHQQTWHTMTTRRTTEGHWRTVQREVDPGRIPAAHQRRWSGKKKWSVQHLYKWSVHAGSSSSTLKEGHQIPETSFFLVDLNDQHGQKLSKRPKAKRGLTSQHPAHTAIPRPPRAVAKLAIDGVESRTAGPEWSH